MKQKNTCQHPNVSKKLGDEFWVCQNQKCREKLTDKEAEDRIFHRSEDLGNNSPQEA